MEKYVIPGVVGLENIGNTCYMNSVLQCLASIERFSHFFVNDDFIERIKENQKQKIIAIKQNIVAINSSLNIDYDVANNVSNTLGFHLAKLFWVMLKTNSTIKPITFKKKIGEINALFAEFSQNDCQEFLNSVLDTIHNELKRSVNKCELVENINEYIKEYHHYINNPNNDIIAKQFKDYKKMHINEAIKYDAYLYINSHIRPSYSIVTSLFTGIFCSQIQCLECNNVSTSFEQFNILSLPLTSNSLKGLLKEFVEPEKLTGANQYHCDECRKKSDAIKKTSLYYSPNILIIQLKRFTNNGIIISKNNSIVTFDIDNLNMNEYIYNPNAQVNYRLKAICMHEGSCNAGHYIAYCRNYINNEWYKYNDHIVDHIPTDSLAQQIITDKAYILMYDISK